METKIRKVTLRNGSTALIYSFHKGQQRPIHGAHETASGWMPLAWEEGGLWAGAGKNHGLDIYPYDPTVG
jgi:hypothetical protein